MMKLGFVSAILPDLTLEEVADFAHMSRFACVELMCWPRGKAERRYAGVTHGDVTSFASRDAARVNELLNGLSVEISGVGYYPNPLTPDAGRGQSCIPLLQNSLWAATIVGAGVGN